MAKDWTIKEHEFMLTHYQDKGRAWVSERLGRTQQAVKQRALANGLIAPRVLKPKQANQRPKKQPVRRGLQRPGLSTNEIIIYIQVKLYQTYSCRPTGELYK